MAQRWSEICFGHGVSQSLLDQFYDRFAEKRNFTHETGKLIHPLTGAYIENQFWMKDFTL